MNDVVSTPDGDGLLMFRIQNAGVELIAVAMPPKSVVENAKLRIGATKRILAFYEPGTIKESKNTSWGSGCVFVKDQ